MKYTMSESVYASSNQGAFVRNGRLVKAVTLALVLGFSGVVGGMVQAAGVTDTTEKGGVAVNLSSDAATGATASGESAIAEGEGATASGENAVAIGKKAQSDSTGAIAIGNNAKTIKVKQSRTNSKGEVVESELGEGT